MSRKIFLGIALSLCFSVGISAQESNKEAPQKAAKQKAEQGKSKNKFLTKLMKGFEKAQLTDEQKAEIKEMALKHREAMKGLQKELGSFMTREISRKRMEAFKAAKAAGKKTDEAKQAGLEAMGLTEENLKKYQDLNAKRTALTNKLKEGIQGLLTEDQKKLVAKRGKGKGKKKKDDADMKEEVSLTSVTVKLPNML